MIGLHGPEGSQRAVVQPGAAFRWRVTAFEPGLAELWLTPGAAGAAGEDHGGGCAVGGARLDDGWGAGWMAGAGSYAELAMQHTLQAQLPSPWINLRFTSPTSFRSGGMHVPLPLPSLMLGHWLEKWNAFAPVALHPDVRSFAEQEVAVNRYDLHTEPVQFGQATIIGFLGQCSLTVRHKDPVLAAHPAPAGGLQLLVRDGAQDAVRAGADAAGAVRGAGANGGVGEGGRGELSRVDF